MPVYLIRAGATGPVKIGKADEPAGRLSELQVAHYEKLQLLRVWEGGEAEEAALHVRFADLHIRGEWFAFSRLMLGDVGLAEFVAPETIIDEIPPDIPPVIGSPTLRDEVWEQVLQKRGTVKRIAEELGISTGAVSQWQRVSRKRLLDVARILGVKPSVLRPDLFAETDQAA